MTLHSAIEQIVLSTLITCKKAHQKNVLSIIKNLAIINYVTWIQTFLNSMFTASLRWYHLTNYMYYDLQRTIKYPG